MERFASLRLDCAKDGKYAHCRLLPTGPEAMSAGGRILTFSAEPVDMAGGSVCGGSVFGSSADVFGLDLAV